MSGTPLEQAVIDRLDDIRRHTIIRLNDMHPERAFRNMGKVIAEVAKDRTNVK